MRRADFFEEDPSPPGFFGTPGVPGLILNARLVAAIKDAPLPDRTDLEVAAALARLVHEELEAYGTGGGQALTEDELVDAISSLRSVLRRLAVEVKLPFRDYTSFRTYWLREGASGHWQARRDLLEAIFAPLHERLLTMEEESFDALADPISPHSSLGWPRVDEEIRELRRRFQTASTSQDYRALGTNCVGVLEALGRVVYDPAKHLRDGESVPPVDKTKLRLGRFIEDAVPGDSNEELRGVANKVIELAHRVKHSETPTRRTAGIAADSVILLANMLRRLEQDI